MAHIYNPSYSGVRDLGGLWFEASLQDKQFTRPYLEKTHCRKGLMEGFNV
jgi:hypothetical protein